MKHYEIVFLVHPDQSSQVPSMVERYTGIIDKNGGKVDRIEDLGRRQLAYSIEKVHKAHYVLMNVTVDYSAIKELKEIFQYNDTIIRHLVRRVDSVETEQSPLAEAKVEKDKRQGRSYDRDRPAQSATSKTSVEKSTATQPAVASSASDAQ